MIFSPVYFFCGHTLALWLDMYTFKQIALQMSKKLAILCRNKFSDPDGWILSGQGGPTWWVIHHILEAVIQAWTGTAWTRTRTSNFSTSFRFCFCSKVSELHGWSPDGHAKIINIFCEGVMTADPNREHVGPSSRVHSCQNLFVSVQKRNHHFDFTNFFACQHLFLILTKLARILWLIFFRQKQDV